MASLPMSFGADVSTAEEMCEVDEERWTAAPIQSDDEDADDEEIAAISKPTPDSRLVY